MSSEQNLRVLVHEVLETSTMPDPGDVAEEVFRRVPPEEHGEALRQTLRLFVRQVIGELRVGNPSTRPAANSGRSAKVRAIRDAWQRRLADRVHVGDSEWKFLRDCTRDDLLAAAAERRKLAERNAAWARTYDGWARLLTEHGVATFGELPAEVLLDTLGAAA